MSTDPLLKAVADGDPRCPDGAALGRLGRLVRSVGPAPANLTARVASARQLPPPAEEDDRLPAPLAQRIAGIAPRPVDLRARVRAAIHAPAAGRTDPQRLRVWLWVGAAHVAALIALAVFTTSAHHESASEQVTGGWAARPATSAPPTARPPAWTALPLAGVDLLAPRRTAAARAEARRLHGGERSAGAVTCALAWMAAQPVPTGDDDTALATRGLMALAFLGEGDTRTARPLLTDLTPARTPVVQGIQALALVELALMDRRPEDVTPARLALGRLVTDVPAPGGLGAYAFLAIEEARAGGLPVPPRQVAAARSDLGRPLPGPDAGVGPMGLAAFARLVLGYRDNPSTGTLVTHLAEHTPQGLADPLGWWLPTLALRTAGGAAWDRWQADLQATLLKRFRDAGPGLAYLPADAARHATNDVLATAAAVLCLQAPYHSIAVGY